MGSQLAQRHKVEQDFHDQAARRTRTDFYSWGALDLADQHAYAQLGDLNGKVLLDLGCGQGANAVGFAHHGALVYAVDLSRGMAETTSTRAAQAGLARRIAAHQMSAEQIAFADSSFDLVFGHSVLHHTDLAISRREIHRILKPGGRAVFLEPLGHNPLLNLFRWLTPARRTPTEKPLTCADISFFAEPFSALAHQEFYCLALAAFALVPLGNRYWFSAVMRMLSRIDRVLLDRVPALRKQCWATVIAVTR